MRRREKVEKKRAAKKIFVIYVGKRKKIADTS